MSKDLEKSPPGAWDRRPGHKFINMICGEAFDIALSRQVAIEEDSKQWKVVSDLGLPSWVLTDVLKVF